MSKKRSVEKGDDGDTETCKRSKNNSSGGVGGGGGGGGAYGRFDLQVRELCYELREGTSHVIFAVFGVVDLIVEYARPVVPLFAPIPPILSTAMDAVDDREQTYAPHRNLDLAWRKSAPNWMRNSDISVGSVFSCPEIGRNPDEAMVDCIVVVPASQCTSAHITNRTRSTHANRFHTESQWIVGVIVPVVRPPPNTLLAQNVHALGGGGGGAGLLDLNDDEKVRRGYRFGADRTLFEDHVSDTDADAEVDAGWQANTAPAEGLYAVHYVNVHCRQFSYWDPVLKRFLMMRFHGQIRPVSQPNPINQLFPHHSTSHLHTHRIHLLPLEIPYHQVEANIIS
jgi:hypothetical protein